MVKEVGELRVELHVPTMASVAGETGDAAAFAVDADGDHARPAAAGCGLRLAPAEAIAQARARVPLHRAARAVARNTEGAVVADGVAVVIAPRGDRVRRRREHVDEVADG